MKSSILIGITITLILVTGGGTIYLLLLPPSGSIAPTTFPSLTTPLTLANPPDYTSPLSQIGDVLTATKSDQEAPEQVSGRG